MKKFLKIFTLCFISILSIIGLAGCGANTNNTNSNQGETQKPGETEERGEIVVSFDTKYGDLSFAEKTYKTNEPIYVNVEDFPIISNEGDERIFDKWIYDNGVEFSSDIPIKSNITLHASFVQSEFVWTEKWGVYDDYYSLYQDTTFNSNLVYDGLSGNDTYESNVWPCLYMLDSNKNQPRFTKIKKTDCLDKYVTKTEYQALTKYCFITSSENSDKFVTEDDITQDVYQYYIDVIVGNQNFGYNAYGYLPKGYSLYDTNLLSDNLGITNNHTKGYCIKKLYSRFVDMYSADYKVNSTFKTGIDLNSSNHFIVLNSNDKEKYDINQLREMTNDDKYTCDYDFTDSIYFGVIFCDYLYCYDYYTEEDVEHFSYIAKDWTDTDNNTTITKKDCTREEFDEFKNQYLSDFTYLKK